jgi:hypothetical protein
MHLASRCRHAHLQRLVGSCGVQVPGCSRHHSQLVISMSMCHRLGTLLKWGVTFTRCQWMCTARQVECTGHQAHAGANLTLIMHALDGLASSIALMYAAL